MQQNVPSPSGALVLDRMEPLRPVVDGMVLKLLLSETLTPGDFKITKEGF